MIPIRDDNPVRGLPVVTPLLMLTCMGAYLWLLSLSPEARAEATTSATRVVAAVYFPVQR